MQFQAKWQKLNIQKLEQAKVKTDNTNDNNSHINMKN